MMVECSIFQPEISFKPEISVQPHQMSACVRLIKVRPTYSQSDIFYSTNVLRTPAIQCSSLQRTTRFSPSITASVDQRTAHTWLTIQCSSL